MTDRDKMIEKLAKVIVPILTRRAIMQKIDGYTLDASDEIAAAVLEMVGPKPLVWQRSNMSGQYGDHHTLPTAYTVRRVDENSWNWACWGCGAYGWEQSEELAQSAAQADADAAHWGNTNIGDLK